MKNVKRIFCILFVLLLSLTLFAVPGFAGDGEGGEGSGDLCQHQWGEGEVTTAPSCTTKGVRTYTCSLCQATKTEEIAMLEHSWGEWGNSTATCTEAGVETRTCSTCEETQTREAAALGHSWGEWTVTTAPTCTEAGVETRTCSVCKETETREAAALGHDWGEWGNSTATCMEAGVETRACSVCEETETREAAALGHDWGEWETTKAPTCVTDGEETQHCSRCDATNTRQIAATGHSWGEWMQTTAPTATSRGEEKRVCSKCDSSETRYIDPLDTGKQDEENDPCSNGHTIENGVCKVCGYRQASFIVTIVGEGKVTWNGTELQSGQRVYVDLGTSVKLIPVPAQSYHVAMIAMDADRYPSTTEVNFTATPDMPNPLPFVFNFAADGQSAQVTRKIVVDMKEGGTISANLQKAMDDHLAYLNRTERVNIQQLHTKVCSAEAYFEGTETKPTADEINRAGGVVCLLPYPDGVTYGNSADFRIFVLHEKNNGVIELMNPVPVAGGLQVKAFSFSTFVAYAVPVVKSAPVTPAPSDGTKIDQAKPVGLSSTDRVDDGTKMAGSISGLDSFMEFKLKDSTEGYTRVTGTTLTNLAAGTYLVRYRETPTMNASPAVEVTISDWYTVTASQLYGKGTYSTDCPKYEDKTNVFLVKKGSNINFTFTPENGYWLHEININDKYVGAANVKKEFAVNGVKAPMTVSFGFSSSSTSPKTGDESNVALWIAVAIAAAAALAVAVWTLFRKKRK